MDKQKKINYNAEKKIDNILLIFEYNPENCPLAIAKMISRFLEQRKIHKIGHLTKKSERKNKPKTPIILANKLQFYRHSVLNLSMYSFQEFFFCLPYFHLSKFEPFNWRFILSQLFYTAIT